MKLFLIKLIVIVLLLVSFGCAHTQVAVYRPLPPVTAEGERAWNILLETIKTFYKDIEYADKKIGEVRSFVFITDKCWAGFLYGGYVPCKTERLVAHVLTLSPFRVEIAVQQHMGTPLSNYREWVEAGNNFEKENDVYEELLKKLRK